ncbi:sodium/pyruvate cotransporter [Cymbomonas tetramitiformis]|uniref:Sodium/pyruvate cotransporter n=1 Tax=Cymbomonas tetramitiformis TaxID=36881 RepID=A0AAE0GB25_9CHLO|nr:sodium/pyruvate cotransporter [Cymbomonas tetramitiformis]
MAATAVRANTYATRRTQQKMKASNASSASAPQLKRSFRSCGNATKLLARVPLSVVQAANSIRALKPYSQGLRRHFVVSGAGSAAAEPEPEPVTEAITETGAAPSTFETISSLLTNLFPLWTLLSALLALKQPSAFSFMTTDSFTACLATLMFSMGITLTFDDFKRVFGKPGVVAIGFVACYVMMPLLALGLGKLFGYSGALLAGIVLVGSINGGQASNLCTYIAKGDVALSVLMTTSTTIGCIFMTPLIAKTLMGTIVPVDAVGIAKSTIQVVLAPIAAGVILNTIAYKFCRAVEPICPLIGVVATVVLVGASVAQCGPAIIDAGIGMQIALALLHLVGGLAGYFFNKAFGYDERTCRTTAIETAMKSSAFGFLLASLHFGDYLARVPSAVSVVWMALIGSSMAVVWRFIPMKD